MAISNYQYTTESSQLTLATQKVTLCLNTPVEALLTSNVTTPNILDTLISVQSLTNDNRSIVLTSYEAFFVRISELRGVTSNEPIAKWEKDEYLFIEQPGTVTKNFQPPPPVWRKIWVPLTHHKKILERPRPIFRPPGTGLKPSTMQPTPITTSKPPGFQPRMKNRIKVKPPRTTPQTSTR